MKPFISLCMIVKNEEKVIGRCLSSVAHLVDEIIVVDTGSTDCTKEIVSEYTSNIYDFKWINDFSAARNYAASKASGKWILVLDADEYVDEENFKDFTQEIQNDNDDFDAYTAKILNFTGHFGENLVQNLHDRIYKNNDEISYYRKIHEQFKNNKSDSLRMKNSSLLIFHSGYLSQTINEKSKNERNRELLDREMNNGSNKAFDYFNFGNEYCSIGEYSKALDSYLEAYRLKSDFRLSWVSTTLVQIIICLINLKRYNDALNVIKDVENIYTSSPEFPYLKGEIFFRRGQLEDAKMMFLQIIDKNEKYNHIIFRPDLKDQGPHIRLGEIYLYQEDYNGAIYHYTSVLNINKHSEKAIQKVIYILNKFHSNEEITTFVYSKGLVDAKNIKSYVKACFDIGNPDLGLSILAKFYEENKLLYKIGLLKKLCIKKEGNLEEFRDILEFPVLKGLIESNWVNIIDLFLLREFINKDDETSELEMHFANEQVLKTLINIFENDTFEETIEEGLIIFVLQVLINYQQFSLCKVILNNMHHLDEKSYSKLAALLYLNGFKVEAIQLYDKGDWNNFNEQDFINIINSLLETNDIVNAVEVAKYAVLVYEEDFRFYQFILENTQDRELLSTTVLKAQQRFLDSIYMEKYAI